MKTLENVKEITSQFTEVSNDERSGLDNQDLSRLVNSFEVLRNRFSKNAFREMINEVTLISFVFRHNDLRNENSGVADDPKFFILSGNHVDKINTKPEYDSRIINKLMSKIQTHYKEELDSGKSFNIQHFIPSSKIGAWKHVSVVPLNRNQYTDADECFLCIVADIFRAKETEECIVSLKQKIVGYAEKNRKLLEYNDSVELYIYALINLLDEYEARIRNILNEIKNSVEKNVNELILLNA